MGFFKKLIKQGIGIAGKQLMNQANAWTGGLAGKAINSMISGANNNAGLIGSVANKLGNKFLTSGARQMLSGAADTAIRYMPKGTVRDALMKINDSAQGRTTDVNKLSTTTKPQKAGPTVSPTAIPNPPETSEVPQRMDAGY